MHKYPYIPLYVSDLMDDPKVVIMNATEFGAYCALLCRAWRETPPATLPTDDRVLSVYSKTTPDQWLEVKSAVLSCFTLRNGRHVQKRLKAEYDRLENLSCVRSAAARSKKQANAEQMLNKSKTNAQQIGSGSGSGSPDPPEGKVQEGEDEAPPWTREQWAAAATSLRVSTKDRDSCWAYWDSEGWMGSKGRRMRGDPRSVLCRWMSHPLRAETSKEDAEQLARSKAADALEEMSRERERMRRKQNGTQ